MFDNNLEIELLEKFVVVVTTIFIFLFTAKKPLNRTSISMLLQHLIYSNIIKLLII